MVVTDVLDGDGDAREESLSLSDSSSRRSPPLYTIIQPYRGTSLIKNSAPLGPYSRSMPRALW